MVCDVILHVPLVRFYLDYSTMLRLLDVLTHSCDLCLSHYPSSSFRLSFQITFLICFWLTLRLFALEFWHRRLMTQRRCQRQDLHGDNEDDEEQASSHQLLMTSPMPTGTLDADDPSAQSTPTVLPVRLSGIRNLFKSSPNVLHRTPLLSFQPEAMPRRFSGLISGYFGTVDNQAYLRLSESLSLFLPICNTIEVF